MADVYNIRRQAIRIELLAEEVQRFAIRAMEFAINPVLSKVRDLTPRWKGGLVRESVGTRAEEGGRVQVVWGRGVVLRVHEENAQWSRMPPHKPILDWVEGKLGLAGKKAQSVAFAIRAKIKARGLTLPNKEGRGQMFKRTFDLMKQTRFHYQSFKSAMKQLLPKSG
jgi:hypothetical protein